MNPEIWYFFTPDGTAEITVLNRESAQQVAHLMNAQQRQQWKVRKKGAPDAMVVADCSEVYDELAGLKGEESQVHTAPAPAPQVHQQPVHQQPVHQQPAPHAHVAAQPYGHQLRQTQPAEPAPIELAPDFDHFGLETEDKTRVDDAIHSYQVSGFAESEVEPKTEIMAPREVQAPSVAKAPEAVKPGRGQIQIQRRAPAHEAPAAAAPTPMAPAPVVAAPTPVRREPTLTSVAKPEAWADLQPLQHPAGASHRDERLQAKARETQAELDEKRKHPRYDARLRVIVISGNRSFRSFTRNISKGGLLLEHIIPVELLERPCRVIIGSSDLKENIEFDARLAGDPQNPRAVEFSEGKELFRRKLDAWLDDLRHKSGRAA